MSTRTKLHIRARAYSSNRSCYQINTIITIPVSTAAARLSWRQQVNNYLQNQGFLRWEVYSITSL